MCEPTTLALLGSAAVSAVGAFAQQQATNAAAMNRAETANRNTRESYRVAQENSRAAQAQAFEKQTDRSRAAARQLSLARVLAAEGGGSLDANAINITAAAADDFSRIDASLGNALSSQRSAMAAASAQGADAVASANVMMQAGKSKLAGDLAGIAVSTGTKYFSQQSEIEIAKNKTPETLRRIRASYLPPSAEDPFPWAGGRRRTGD